MSNDDITKTNANKEDQGEQEETTPTYKWVQQEVPIHTPQVSANLDMDYTGTLLALGMPSYDGVNPSAEQPEQYEQCLQAGPFLHGQRIQRNREGGSWIQSSSFLDIYSESNTNI